MPKGKGYPKKSSKALPKPGRKGPLKKKRRTSTAPHSQTRRNIGDLFPASKRRPFGAK